MTDFDISTPGALVGKTVLYKNKYKAIIEQEFYSKDTNGNIRRQFCLQYETESSFTRCGGAFLSDISPWKEPVTKRKVKRVKVYYVESCSAYIAESVWCLTIEEIKSAYGLSDERIIETEYREFEE